MLLALLFVSKVLFLDLKYRFFLNRENKIFLSFLLGIFLKFQ